MEELLKEILSKLNKLDSLENQLVNVTEQQTETVNRITKLESTIENKTNVKIQALFEDRQIFHDKLNEMKESIDILKQK